MAMYIGDPTVAERLLVQRRESGADRHDEVWEGVYFMAPLPNNEHQELVLELGSILRANIDRQAGDRVYPGVNLTDRLDDWTHNFRAPDLVVFLHNTAAYNGDTFWSGAADFVVELVSPFDRTREKMDFYEKIGTRELLIVDRDPWQLELYQLQDAQLVCVGKSNLAAPAWLTSSVLPLELQLVAGETRPQIFVRRNDGQQGEWLV